MLRVAVDSGHLPAALAVVAVEGPGPFGRRYLDRLAAAVRSYR